MKAIEIISPVIIILTVALAIILALKTELLRDPKSCVAPAGNNTYSLSRTQLFLWTVVIFCSYIYLLTQAEIGQVNVTKEVAILLGISVGTTVMGKSIESTSGSALKYVNIQGVKLDTPEGCSQGFIKDILSDKSGISVHRFQQVLFTMLLLAVYLIGLLEIKNFPVLDHSLLILAGVSSGGYLGVKMSEK